MALPFHWAWLLLPGLALFALALCWWGADTVFHPPKMLPNVVTPEEFGLSHEAVSFPTPDGLMLRGWIIPAAKTTTKTVLLCHGWGDNKGDILRRFHFLADSYNLLAFDSRAHGESDGDLTSIGHLETIDFDAALAFLKSVRPQWCARLGLVGLSMGAAMSIHGMARHPDFRCAVLESPFQSFNGVVTQFSKNSYSFLPYFPFIWLVLVLIRLRLGSDPEPSSPIYHIKKLPPVPLLFIAGEEDRLMPVSEVRELYEAAREPKSYWQVPEAGHGGCQEARPEEYERRVRDFLAENL